MPNVTLPNGKSHYVNPFSMLCDCCERREPSDWIDKRCRYECVTCQRDVQFEEELELACREFFIDREAAE